MTLVRLCEYLEKTFQLKGRKDDYIDDNHLLNSLLEVVDVADSSHRDSKDEDRYTRRYQKAKHPAKDAL